jgi:hypothetical protein
MKVKIEFDTEKQVGDKDRLHVRLFLEDFEMEQTQKLAKKLGMTTAEIIFVANRLAFNAFDGVVGHNERLGFKELLATVEEQVEWGREQEKKNGQH